ncbi:MAG: hypothetical protein V2J51_13145 [Erythrobacter sp.]|jgi:hypothetical protein|nr:hypothetical protein [Erythrobacter sp.]
MRQSTEKNIAEKIALNWIKYTLLYPKAAPEELMQTSFKFMDICKDDPILAWNVILKVMDHYTLREAQSKGSDGFWIISNLAAGPIEDLLVYNGETLISTIEREAKRNPLLRHTLKGVWRNKIDQKVWDRLGKIP